MPDLDALRARKWSVWAELVEALDDNEQALWHLHALHGMPTDAVVTIEHRDRATAEAMLLAACERADGLPTERERVMEEALRWIATATLTSNAGGLIAQRHAQEALAALVPTKEAQAERETCARCGEPLRHGETLTSDYDDAIVHFACGPDAKEAPDA